MTPQAREPELSIVIPVHSERDLVSPLVEALRRVLSSCVESYEILFVDDGSTDGTWQELERLAAEDPQICAVSLSRRFGKEAAITAGLGLARGRGVVVMDGDLQHPPALIPQLVDAWRRGADIAEGVQRRRDRDPRTRRWAARLFYLSSRWLAGFDLEHATDFKLLDRRVVEHLNDLEERSVYFRGLVAWIGFQRESIPFDVEPRDTGTSAWDFTSLIGLALTAITAFSAIPLRLVSFFGALFLGTSILLSAHTLYVWARGDAIDGFVTVILLQLITGSLVLIGLGIVGEYIAKIYIEVKRRPRFFPAKTIGARFVEEETSDDG